MSEQSTYIIPETSDATELANGAFVDMPHGRSREGLSSLNVSIARQAVAEVTKELLPTPEQTDRDQIARSGDSIAAARRFELDSRFVVSPEQQDKLAA